MATFTFDGTTSAEIEFDPAADVLEFNVATADVVDVTENEDGVTITTASGAVLTLTGVTYAELADANIVVQGGGNFSFNNEGTGFSDVLVGSTDGETIAAGNGNNLVFGGGSVVAPADGVDNITAAAGNDTIYGNGGADIISSTGGNDLVYGGVGADNITLNPATGQTVTVFGGGSDFDPADEGDTITINNAGLQAGGAALVFGNGGDDIININANGNNTVYGGYGADAITVGSSVTGATGSNLIFGGDNVAGPEDDADEVTVVDTITVFSDGNNTIFGGVGEADPLDGIDVITVTGDGNNLVFANGGDDAVSINGEGDNTVYGGLGDDSITVGAESSDGSNLIVAGLGEDTIAVTSDGDNVVYGGDGLANPTDSADAITVTGDGNNSVFGNGGGDTLSVNGDGNNSVYGGFGDDTITIGASGLANGNNVVFGGEDADTITITGDGDNVVYGGTGEVDTTDANDAITVTGNGNNLVFGNAGNDRLTVSGEGSNSVYGGLGADVISVTGGAAGGESLLIGGEGADAIIASTAGDVTVFGGMSTEDTTDLADTIDVTVSGEGSATIYGNGGDDLIDVTVAGEATAVVFGGRGDDTITFANFNPDAPTDTADTSATVFGGEGGDSITINTEGNVTVFGGIGEVDAADSADDIDVSVAGEGAATIFGNGGDDTIDVLINDDATAVVLGGEGDDEITISDASTNNDVTLAAVSAEDLEGPAALVYGGQGDDLIDLGDFSGAATIYGGTGEVDPTDGDDVITTGEGPTVVFGNGGDDTIIVNGEATVNGGAGEDTVVFNGEAELQSATVRLDEQGNFVSFASVTTAAGVVTLTDVEAIEVNGTTYTGAEFLEAFPATVMNADGTFTGYASVQAAINAAEANDVDGDTVMVRAGTFDGDIVISEAGLKLVGANAGVAAGGERGAESVINGNVSFVGAAEGASINGFQIVNGETGVALENSAVIVQVDGVSISNNVITAEDGGVTGIVVAGGVSGTSITGNEIDGFADRGVFLNPASAGEAGAVVTGNIISGSFQGVVVEFNSAETVSGNTFADIEDADIRISIRTSEDFDASDVIGANTQSGGEAEAVSIFYSDDSDIGGTTGSDLFTFGPTTGGVYFDGDDLGVTLAGNGGADTFAFDAEINTPTTITDFASDDTIDFGGAAGTSANFFEGANVADEDAAETAASAAFVANEGVVYFFAEATAGNAGFVVVDFNDDNVADYTVTLTGVTDFDADNIGSSLVG